MKLLNISEKWLNNRVFRDFGLNSRVGVGGLVERPP